MNKVPWSQASRTQQPGGQIQNRKYVINTKQMVRPIWQKSWAIIALQSTLRHSDSLTNNPWVGQFQCIKRGEGNCISRFCTLYFIVCVLFWVWLACRWVQPCSAVDCTTTCAAYEAHHALVLCYRAMRALRDWSTDKCRSYPATMHDWINGSVDVVMWRLL